MRKSKTEQTLKSTTLHQTTGSRYQGTILELSAMSSRTGSFTVPAGWSLVPSSDQANPLHYIAPDIAPVLLSQTVVSKLPDIVELTDAVNEKLSVVIAAKADSSQPPLIIKPSIPPESPINVVEKVKSKISKEASLQFVMSPTINSPAISPMATTKPRCFAFSEMLYDESVVSHSSVKLKI